MRSGGGAGRGRGDRGEIDIFLRVIVRSGGATGLRWSGMRMGDFRRASEEEELGCGEV